MKESGVFEWLDIFESSSAETAAICRLLPDLGDGVRRYDSPQSIRVVRTSARQSGADEGRSLKIVVLIPGCTPAIKSGDLLQLAGNSCEIGSVEYCTAVSGEVIARKCTVS